MKWFIKTDNRFIFRLTHLHNKLWFVKACIIIIEKSPKTLEDIHLEVLCTKDFLRWFVKTHLPKYSFDFFGALSLISVSQNSIGQSSYTQYLYA